MSAESAGGGLQAVDSGKSCSSSSRVIYWSIPSSHQEYQPFVIFRPSIDWLRPTHIIESSFHYLKFTYFNVYLIKTLSHKYLEKCQTKFLGTMAQTCWQIELIITNNLKNFKISNKNMKRNKYSSNSSRRHQINIERGYLRKTET